MSARNEYNIGAGAAFAAAVLVGGTGIVLFAFDQPNANAVGGHPATRAQALRARRPGARSPDAIVGKPRPSSSPASTAPLSSAAS